MEAVKAAFGRRVHGVGRSKQQRCEVPSKENTARVERMKLWVLIHEDQQERTINRSEPDLRSGKAS